MALGISKETKGIVTVNNNEKKNWLLITSKKKDTG